MENNYRKKENSDQKARRLSCTLVFEQNFPSFSHFFQPVKEVGKSNATILSWQPGEIAQQLTFLEFELFSCIQIAELSNNVWSKAKKQELAPNVMKMIDNSNNFIRWISSEIVATPNLKKRIAVMKHCVSIASVKPYPVNKTSPSKNLG